MKTLGKLSRRSATMRFAKARLLPDEDDALVLHGRCTHHIAALHMVRGTMATRRGLSDPTFPPIDLWLLRGLLLVGDPTSCRTLCKKSKGRRWRSTAETAAGAFQQQLITGKIPIYGCNSSKSQPGWSIQPDPAAAA